MRLEPIIICWGWPYMSYITGWLEGARGCPIVSIA